MQIIGVIDLKDGTAVHARRGQRDTYAAVEQSAGAPVEGCALTLARHYVETFGLADRGVLKEGNAADITIFDAGTVDEAATFARPIQPAKGIDAVIVNGEIVWRDGKATGARPGRVLARAF